MSSLHCLVAHIKEFEKDENKIRLNMYDALPSNDTQHKNTICFQKLIQCRERQMMLWELESLFWQELAIYGELQNPSYLISILLPVVSYPERHPIQTKVAHSSLYHSNILAIKLVENAIS